jgi:hypothetical protein
MAWCRQGCGVVGKRLNGVDGVVCVQRRSVASATHRAEWRVPLASCRHTHSHRRISALTH